MCIETEEAGGPGEGGRVDVIAGVTFEATRQKSSKLSRGRVGVTGTETRRRKPTFFDSFPYAVLVSFTEAGHAFCVSPTDEVGLLELPHKCLLAGLGAWREKQFVRRG